MAGAILLYLAIADAAIETAIAGSPVRWFVLAVTGLYGAITALRWRRWTWQQKAVTSALVLLAMIAATCWIPGGLTDGVRLASLPTSIVLHLASAAGIALAAIQIGRFQRAPVAARLAGIAVALYSMAAFVIAIVRGDAFATLFTSGSFWWALPFVLQGAALALFLVIPAGVVVIAVRSGLRVPAPGTFRRDAHEGIALIAILVMLAATIRPGQVAGGNVVATGEESAQAGGTLAPPGDVDHALRALADARNDFRRERWDPAFVADHLGADAAELFRWVRGNTFWIPYQGVLRGPVGVLMDRQGNSLDRSLLLAELLGRSGREVRLAHAELSREQAVSRIARVLVDAPLTPSSAEEPLAEPQDDVRSVAGTYQLEPDGVARKVGAAAQVLMATYSELDTRVADQRERLLAAVPKPDRRAEFGRRFDSALTAMRDHWWLQVKDADRWVDFDLLENVAGVAAAQPSATYDPRGLPASLYHDIALRIVAVQQGAGVSRSQTILEHTFRPLDVIGRPMAIQLYPLRAPNETPPVDNQAFEAQLAGQEAWGAAIFAGNNVVATGSINARGEREAGGGMMGGLGSAIGRQYQNQNPTELAALSVEYVIRSPGLPTRTISRPLFDFTDQGGLTLDSPAKIQRALALMTRTEILPTGWELSPDYVADQAVQALAANRERLLAAASLPANAAADTQVPDKPKAEPSVSPLLMLALARFEWSRVGHLVFHDRPNVVARHQQIAKDADTFVLRTSTDIVANEVGVDLAADDGFAVRLEQGVMDTNAESLLQFGTPVPGNTADAFVGATNWVTVTPRDDPGGAAGLTGPAARLAARDLEAGRVLVTPRRGAGAEVSPSVGWWRVDPNTGDTLGIGASGAGEASGLILALQSAGETSVHYSLLTTMAEGFIFQEAFCRAAPLPFIAMRAAWRMYINNLATPEIKNSGLVVSMQLQGSAWDDLKSSATGSTKLCLFAMMAAGVLVTLPLVLMSMRFAMLGRVATVAAEEGAARAAASGGRPPRFGRGPSRPAPGRGAAPEPAPAPEPAKPGGSGSPGGKPPRPDECPQEFGRGRRDDGFGNYPPNTPSEGPLSPSAPPDPFVDPYLRSPAEDAAWAEQLQADIASAQQAFDEALAQYRAAAQKVESMGGKPDFEARTAEQLAEQNLNRTRYDLIRSKQRAAYAEQLNPAAEGLRDARAAMEEAMKAQDASWETYAEQFKRVDAAKQKYLDASSKKLNDFPADATPSPGSGESGANVPPPLPGGGGGGACGGGSGASGASGSGGSGGTGAGVTGGANTQDLGRTQPDLGATLPGGRPGPTYAPVRGGPPAPAAPTKTLVGVGGMLGGGS